MKKKIFSFIVVAALLVSAFSVLNVSAAVEPEWIWTPSEDGFSDGNELCTGTDSDDGTYTTLSTIMTQPEGFTYLGSGANLANTAMGAIDTETSKVALLKYRTSMDEKVYGEFVWHNGSAHGFREFTYVHDGNWNFAIVDMTKDISSGSAEWTSIPQMTWFRYDFANNLDADKTYDVDVAYLAFFENEADAKAYADADKSATVPDDNPSKPDDTQKPDDKPNDNPNENPPKTGDASVIFAIAAAGLVLTVVMKKKVSAC